MPAAPAGVCVVNLTTNDLVYNPVTAKIYASLPSNPVVAGSNPGNSIVAIDPLTGAMDTPIFIGSEPGKLALSDNGQSLFVGLNGAAAVRRLDIPTKLSKTHYSISATLFPAGHITRSTSRPFPAARTRLLSRNKSLQSNPSNAGVAIFDSGVPRSNVVRRGRVFLRLAGVLV